MKISIEEAQKQKAQLERHLLDMLQIFEERTGTKVAAIDLLRWNPISTKPEAGRLITAAVRVEL